MVAWEAGVSSGVGLLRVPSVAMRERGRGRGRSASSALAVVVVVKGEVLHTALDGCNWRKCSARGVKGEEERIWWVDRWVIGYQDNERDSIGMLVGREPRSRAELVRR